MTTRTIKLRRHKLTTRRRAAKPVTITPIEGLVALYEVLWERDHTERCGDELQKRADAGLEAVAAAAGFTMEDVVGAVMARGRRKAA